MTEKEFYELYKSVYRAREATLRATIKEAEVECAYLEELARREEKAGNLPAAISARSQLKANRDRLEDAEMSLTLYERSN